MTRRFDIRAYKKNLRLHYKQQRRDMPPEVKQRKDKAIYRHLTALSLYRDAALLLCYVSTDIEVDTHRLIGAALEQGKSVAVPYCVNGSRHMEFYRIKAMDQLVRRTFGVLEPVPETCERIRLFENAICVVPGLSFDHSGYRLGYGGGYYDRFLSGSYAGKPTVGICYGSQVRGKLTHGRHDVPCDFLVTEGGARRIRRASPRKRQ